MRVTNSVLLALACGAAGVTSVGGCTTAADCYALATAEDLMYLSKFDEQLICDTSCSTSNPPPIHCNQFGLGQNCRQCFNSKEAAAAYFKLFPGQPGQDTYALCPNAIPDTTSAPTSAPSMAPVAPVFSKPVFSTSAPVTPRNDETPTAAAPTAEAPTASAPTAAAPTASTPTAAAPTASAPTAAAPTASTPTGAAPTPGSNPDNIPPSLVPSATSRPVVSLPPIVSAPTLTTDCCTTAADCYARASAADLEYLNKFSESLVCDVSCSITGGIHCNIFGLCQNCRQCFNTMADVENYFTINPEQRQYGYILCPGSPQNPATTPAPAPTSGSTGNDEMPTATQPTATPADQDNSCTAQCYSLANASELEYLNKFNKQMVCDSTCSTVGGSHCNMFGLGQNCRGCFETQADADYYFTVFPEQKGDAYILCPATGGDGGITSAPTSAPVARRTLRSL